jgi:hypothetical protein
MQVLYTSGGTPEVTGVQQQQAMQVRYGCSNTMQLLQVAICPPRMPAPSCMTPKEVVAAGTLRKQVSHAGSQFYNIQCESFQSRYQHGITHLQ